MNNKLVFRYDINALRAIAVLAVLLFHFKVPNFDGGFIGVDVFFVISGYLMTGIILKGLERSNFSLVDFYNRRAKRIIPELLLMVLVIVFLTFFFYLPVDYYLVARNASASLLFFSNVLYAKGSYFDASSDTNVFLHTWSLSVEWQFYLLLPLLLLSLNRFFRNDRKRFLILFLIAILVFWLFTLWCTKNYPTYSFYLLPSRAWEMLVGGVAFLSEGRLKIRGSKAVAISGYLIICASVIFFNDRIPWPGMLTFIPVLATFLVIIADVNVFSVLHNRFVQLTGKLSYSLYLWHWPVLVVANYLGIQAGLTSSLMFLGLSTVLSFLSFNFVERLRIQKSTRVYLLAGLVAMVTTSFTKIDVNRIRFKEGALRISRYKENHKEEAIQQFNKKACFISSENEVNVNFDKISCLTLDPKKRNILLIGDSHAAHLSQSLREGLASKNIHLLQASVSGCLPMLNPEGESRCESIIHYVYDDFIPNHAEDIDGVVISANWCSEPVRDVIQDLTVTMNRLNAADIPTLVIGQNEIYTIPYTSIAAREFEYGVSLSDQYVDEKAAVMNDSLKLVFKEDYVDIYQLNSFSKLSDLEEPYMMDQNHFTKYGADCVSKNILKDKEFEEFLDEALEMDKDSTSNQEDVFALVK